MGVVIKRVLPHSPAARAGIQAGDTLNKINGREITDVLDYKYSSNGIKISAELASGRVRLIKRAGEELGLEFDTYLIDKPRSCSNKCVFCFVDQLPKGMRRTLYFKDDDSRLSFLMGNYITMTNLTDREVERIIQLRISPINISVHASDTELRKRLLGCDVEGRDISLMRRFAEAGIEMNCQIVVCPGLNDGARLEETLRCLAALYPAVPSVSVVPVGLTKHREGLAKLTPFSTETALRLVSEVAALNDEFNETLGSRLAFCADELFIKAGLPIPPEEYYEGYPQIENGVGLLRSLFTEFEAARETSVSADISIATGVSAAPFIEKLIKTANPAARVYPIKNLFFGETVDVAGLVTGGDLLSQLEGKPLGKKLLIPSVMLRDREGAFLDDITLDDVTRSLGVPVVPVDNDGARLFAAVTEVSAD